MSEFVELVTGRGDPTAPHVGPEDDAALRRGIMGAGNYVFQSDNLDAVMKDANHITVPPMELLLHGRHARVKQAVDVPVDSGTQAQERIDTACIQLTRDDEGIESADLIVVKGTPASSNPVAPEFDETADFDSASSVTVPLYDIPLDGITVGTPTQRFTQIGPLKAVWDSVSQPFLEARFKFQDKTSWVEWAYDAGNAITVKNGFITVDLSSFTSTVHVDQYAVWNYLSGIKPSKDINLGKCATDIAHPGWGKQLTWKTNGDIVVYGGLSNGDKIMLFPKTLPAPSGVTFN